MQPSLDAPIIKKSAWIEHLFNVDSIEQLWTRCQQGGSPDEKAWRLQQLAIIKKACPISLKLTLEAFKRGEELSLADVLQQDLRLAKHCLHGENFYEGVRACLIDRDTPHWQPLNHTDIPEKTIQQWFESDPIYD
jgi:enoyl-CoA hydratase